MFVLKKLEFDSVYVAKNVINLKALRKSSLVRSADQPTILCLWV